MSSRHDYRRRDRSWERDERDRDRDRHRHRDGPRRSSRSRSPRRGDRDRRPLDRGDYGRGRGDDRRDRDRRDDRRMDDPDRRDYDRDARRGPPQRDRERERDRGSERAVERGPRDVGRGSETSVRPDDRRSTAESDGGREGSHFAPSNPGDTPDSYRRQESEARTEEGEEGQATDIVNDDEAAMMAMMGLPASGFGTTKGKHVEGNQEGAVDVKKMRTWRQYMNRRGGFNRPLDKIK
ncbi:hypothetical protein OBBRIDRAFT_816825 [Obba rivulosa]|uniref:U4/U6.U5 small nuclear ribonucleoprotein 27kDa protein domain-containing protein n=1 Tax=Obba rivulosa TaxID=1052685 RepID=A0A8E2J5D9_9APHY|nr:hypothetical protein OBBRIDRAFT_816825 [Obba rivulosa]